MGYNVGAAFPMSERDSTGSTAGADPALDSVLQDLARMPVASGAKRPGDSFARGRYVIQRHLGTGGQKIVFLVKDQLLRRDCALSLILAEHVVRPFQLDRFRL